MWPALRHRRNLTAPCRGLSLAAGLLACFLDLRHGAVESFLDPLELFGILETRRRRIRRAGHVLECLVHLEHRRAEEAGRELRDPIEDLIDGALVLLEIRAAFR